MRTITLYKYIRKDGGTTVSLHKPVGIEYTTLLRLIANEGKALTMDGINTMPCRDVESTDGWYEIDDISLFE